MNSYGFNTPNFDGTGQLISERSDTFIYEVSQGIGFPDRSVALWGCGSPSYAVWN